MSEMKDAKVSLSLSKELWDHAAGWITKNAGATPTSAAVYGVVATLLHLGASVWRRFEPPQDQLVTWKFDENAFLELARQMYRKAAPPA